MRAEIKNYNPAQDVDEKEEILKQNFEELSKAVNGASVNEDVAVIDATQVLITTAFQSIPGLEKIINSSGGNNFSLGAVHLSAGGTGGTCTYRIYDVTKQKVIFKRSVSTGTLQPRDLPLNLVFQLEPGLHKLQVQVASTGAGHIVNNASAESYFQVNEFLL